ncbi:MAG: TIGR01906 family membrane protein [Peptoniphilus sp.]|nr:TIGR01906 family membrane protein [Peptoniphilus sp.]MDD7363125.1 TIGR01906 family membrane protein [Bacillota bacterium]MDY6044353.1 TIGR01906 family membrane protein [Peptoniphilus sp.]
MNRLLSIIVVLCGIFLLFSFSTESISQSRSYYHKQMIENGIEEITGKDISQLDEISDALRAYLREGRGEILSPYFSADEIEHMVDVYALFDLMRDVSIWAITLLFLCFYGLSLRVGITKGLAYIGQSAVVLTVLLVAFSAIVALNFHTAWYTFHEIFFSNDLWLMDPKTDLMIQMLPESFFFGMAKRIGITVIAGLLAMCGLSFLKGEKHGVK